MNLKGWEEQIATSLGVKVDRSKPAGYIGQDPSGSRYQVKVRRLTRGDHISRRVSQRGDPAAFDVLVVALVDEAATEIRHAWRLTSACVTDFAHPTTDRLGWWIRMTDALRADPRVEDISLSLGGAEASANRQTQSVESKQADRDQSLHGTRKREPIPSRLRFDVLRRDGFRCYYCGRTAADGVKLHVDHIEPLAEGGRTIIENLVAACDTCNLGKGSRPVI